MALIPITKDTSFRDIAIAFEWWILFGIIIIYSSKSPLDSSLKCFVFFLISQPLIYLIQVPFSSVGWGIFGYYKYWFLWTIACLPMGYIGYYIRKNNIFSVIILFPMLMFLALLGLGYLSAALENFPHHLLSTIFCFVTILILIFNIFDKKYLRIITLSGTIIFIIVCNILTGGIIGTEYDAVKSLEEYDFSGEVEISYYSGDKKGKVELIKDGDHYNIKLNGRKAGNYSFELRDEEDNNYKFE